MELHHLLVPTDFSVYAEQAFQEALVLAALEKAQSLLLHVLGQCEWMWTEMLWPTRRQLMHELHTEAEQRLQTVAARQLWPIETLVVWGDPTTEICRIAQGYRTDLIVMSTHGRTGLARMFMGSVTEHVVRSAPCSVLIVRACQPRAARVAQSPVLRYFDWYSPGETAWLDPTLTVDRVHGIGVMLSWKRHPKGAGYPCPEHLCVQDTRRRAGPLSPKR